MTQRIVTANSSTSEASIIEFDDTQKVEPVSALQGLGTKVLWSSSQNPANNEPAGDLAVEAPGGLSCPGGTKCWMTELSPGSRAPMHRTSTLDYNVITQGSVHLILTNENGEEYDRKVSTGDVVIQRGNIHAWENKGTETCRWITVVTEAKPVKIKDPSQRELEDVLL